MNIIAGDNGCTITRWDKNEFHWKDEGGLSGIARYNQITCQSGIWTTNHTTVLPTTQLIAWLRGEPPPEQPIMVGDKVMKPDGHVIYTVLAIDDDLLWCRFNGQHYTFFRNQLHRVG